MYKSYTLSHQILTRVQHYIAISPHTLLGIGLNIHAGIIGTHDVDHERVDPCLTQGGISAACLMLMW